MNRGAWQASILEHYDAQADFPWLSHPHYEVFRHRRNRKWFALMMDVPGNKLGLQDTGILEVCNLKCDPLLVGILREKPGFFPAYHMNKENWITVVMDGRVLDEQIKLLLDESYAATAPQPRRKSKA